MNRLKEIEERLAAIANDMNEENADLDALQTEVRSLKEERKGLQDKAEQRANLLKDIAVGKQGEEVRTFVAQHEERKEYTADSKEYRNAYFKNLLGKDMNKEERAAFTHITTNTAAVMPTTMLNQIWDLVSEQHSIMGDITIYRTGTTLELVKHVSIDAGKAKKVNEATANDDEKNTFVKVTLSGQDFSKHVDISYAMQAMSMDAFESYLIGEISRELGRILAEDVIAQIKGDMNAANKVTTATAQTEYKDAAKAFAVLKRVSGVTIYTNYATLYNQLVSMVDTTGRPIYQPSAQVGAMGVLLGGNIKIEEALADGEILIGDPKKVVYNMVQDIMIENERDIKKHVITYSGYARGEGVLIDDKGFALLTVKTGA